MAQRRRPILLVLAVIGGFLLTAGAIVGGTSMLESIDEQDRKISALETEVANSKNKLRDLSDAQRKLDQWRTMSLPPDRAVANRRYRSFLEELCRRNQFQVRHLNAGGDLRSPVARTGAQFTPGLSYSLKVEGTLSRLIGFLKDFYAVNLPHLIRDMTITTLGTEARLEIEFRIEALSLPNATNRDYLLAVPALPLVAVDAVTAMKQGPSGLALVPLLLTPVGAHGRKLAAVSTPERDYTQLVRKNVFAGLVAPTPPDPPPVVETPKPDRDVLKYVQLTSIVPTLVATEATLRNRLANKFLTLRAEGGYDTFTIRDTSDQVVLKAKVKMIEGRNLVFQSDEKHYLLHVGQTLDKALEKELSAKELEAFGLGPPANAENP